MQANLDPRVRLSHSAILAGALWAVVAGCQQPMVIDSLHGRAQVYPNVVRGRPTLLAFLSANDRRCDDAIKPLLALHYREGTPVQVIAVVVYDRFSYVRSVEGIDKVPFLVLLDPDRRVAAEHGVRHYPTYVFLDIDGDELERVHDVRQTRAWVDSPLWHEKAHGLEPGTYRRIQDIREHSPTYPVDPGDPSDPLDPRDPINRRRAEHRAYSSYSRADRGATTSPYGP